MTTKLIIDTDAGIDDAQALMMALASPDVEVSAITMLSGNVHLDKVTQNVARVLDVCGADVPFYRGALGPLVGSNVHADNIHGEDGLGDGGIPLSNRQPEDEHAVHTLLRMVNDAPGEYTIVPIGPLTNIALAVRIDPTFVSKVKDLIIMGGTDSARGNVTWMAEFNFYADPEAAHIVLSAFPRASLVTWECTLTHQLEWEWFTQWVQTDTPKGRFMHAITARYSALIRREFRATGYFIPDPLAMAVAINPQLVLEAEARHATVELWGQHTRGQTVIDYAELKPKARNVSIVRKLDMAGVKALLQASLA